jgi:hypothetical protein
MVAFEDDAIAAVAIIYYCVLWDKGNSTDVLEDLTILNRRWYDKSNGSARPGSYIYGVEADRGE